MIDDTQHTVDGEADIDSLQNDKVGPDMQPMSPVSLGSGTPTVGRPKRDRRPNVKYRPEEYNLSSVSASKCMLLSCLYVKQYKPMDGGRC